jgi:hypothetical protein
MTGSRANSKRKRGPARQTSPRAGRRIYVYGSIGVAILVVVGIGGYVAFRLANREKTLEERVFSTVQGWDAEANRGRTDLVRLLESADRAITERDEDALRRISAEADELGRELSKLRVRVSRANVPEDETLDFIRNHSNQAFSYVVEAVENIQALRDAPVDTRPDLVAQAHRFLVLADASNVWVNMFWQEYFSLGDRQLLATQAPIDDSALQKWRWTPHFADGLPKELDPWNLDGIPASQVGAEASSDETRWVEVETRAAQATEITANVSGACAELEKFARADMKDVDEGILIKALEANRTFANMLAPAAAPADSLLTYSAAWKGTRGYHEAYMTGITADELGSLRIRWLFKTYRLALLAGASWNQGLWVAERRQIPFGYVPSCTGRLEILLLSPWDVRQDLTSVIPGPRADG